MVKANETGLRACARASGVLVLALASIAGPPHALAQSDSMPPVDTVTVAPARPFPAWQAGAVAGLGLLTIAVLDDPVRTWSQDPANRSDGLDDLADVTRKFGEAVVIAPVTIGLIAVGAIADKPPLLHAGLRVGASVLLTSAVTQVVKYSLGRERPSSTDDPWDFEPFGGGNSMWSGHTATAFAFATALSQEIDRPWATVGLYALATGTAWSRVYNNAHWASDVLVGAAAGIACAKLATGRWTIFGLRAPAPLVSEGRAGLVWSGTF